MIFNELLIENIEIETLIFANQNIWNCFVCSNRWCFLYRDIWNVFITKRCNLSLWSITQDLVTNHYCSLYIVMFNHISLVSFIYYQEFSLCKLNFFSYKSELTLLWSTNPSLNKQIQMMYTRFNWWKKFEKISPENRNNF